MRNLKKMLTIGVATAMVSSMVVGVFATTKQDINYKPSLDTASNIGYVDAEASATIDVNGHMQYGAQPMNSDGSTVPTGDESVNRTHQLILTAPTKMEFWTEQEKDKDGNNLPTASLTTTTGTILNYSAYYEGKGAAAGKGYPAVAKEVEVKLNSVVANGGDFVLGDQAKLESSGKMGAVDRLFLQLANPSVSEIGINPAKTNDPVAFIEREAGTPITLGTMKGGSIVNKAEGTNLSPSKAVIKFTGVYSADAGTTEKSVLTSYREEATNNLDANFTIGLLFKYIYEPYDDATGEGYHEDSATLLQ